MTITEVHYEHVIDHARLFPAQVFTHHEPGLFSCPRRLLDDHRLDSLYQTSQAGADPAEPGGAASTNGDSRSAEAS
jgi:hypothetical protein